MKKIIMIIEIIVVATMLLILTGCNKTEEKNIEVDNSNSVVSKSSEEDLYPVYDEKNKLSGYVNKKGEWVIEPKYVTATDFDKETGLACVRTSRGDYAEGFINKKGEIVIEDKYGRGTHGFHNGYAVVETNIKGGSTNTYNTLMLIDKDQNVIIEAGKYIKMTDVSDNGLIGVVDGSEMKYIDLKGNVVIEKKFGSNGTMFNSKGFACVEDGLLTNSYIIINEKGEEISKTQKITLNDNNIGFVYGEHYAIANEKGEKLSDEIYYSCSEFSNNDLAMVKIGSFDGLYILINSKGEKVNDTLYKNYKLLADGKWTVTLEDGKHQVLNSDGSVLVDSFE